MKKYLYNVCFHIDNAMIEGGYCIDERDLSANDIKGEDEDNRFEVFEKMISTHSSFYDKEWQCMTDIEIIEKVDCTFTCNRYLPNKFYKSLSWFNKAIQQYTDRQVTQKELKDSISEITSWDCCRDHSWESMTETTIIHAQCYYLTHYQRLINYCGSIIREIVKTLNLPVIESYDRIIQHRKEDLEIIRLPYNKYITALQVGDTIDILKNNLLHYTEKIALEITFILGELNSCLRYSPFGFDVIRQSSLRETMLFFKRRLIIEKKKYEIEHEEIAVTLTDIKSEKFVAIDKEDKDSILGRIVSFKNRNRVMQMLDEIDKSYMISTTPKYSKSQLGTLIYIMYCSKFINKLSYEAFKQEVCAYYGKVNISTRPNKVRHDAVKEYTSNDFRFSNYEIDFNQLENGISRIK